MIVVSSSVLDPAWRPSGAWFFNHVLDPLVNRRLGRTVNDDMRRMEALLRVGDALWTIMRPSGLFSGDRVTRYRLEPDSADGLFTSRSDLAAAMLGALDDDTTIRATVGVVTDDGVPSIAGVLWNEAVRRPMPTAYPSTRAAVTDCGDRPT